MMSFTIFNREGSNSDGVKNGSQLVGELRSLDKQVIQGEPDMLRREKNSGEELHANDVQIRSQSVGNSKLVIRDLTEGEPILLRSEDNVKNLSNIRKGINVDGVQNGSKVVGNSRSQKKEATSGKPVQLRSDNSLVQAFVMLCNYLADFNPSSSTEKLARSSGNSKFVISRKESTQNLQIHSVEGDKIGKRTPEKFEVCLHALGANRDIPTVLRQNNSLRNTEQNTKLAGNTTSKIAHPVGGTEKQKSENIREVLKNLREELLKKRPEVSREINMTELEIPLIMENDGNVEKAEKAEAYTQDLEDICNMLKKKHEEAKELLVLATVNNNNLLIFNHPIYEEKISF
ncbi:hypothetical protein Ddye_020009 [Dipteronia dyeriana]|uniref:Uncharacterized protein n=1 Tax=Dipteronia dyeriana TaxID=168575 RepID=A0AAD9TYU7_9ROSI|nr:hypothetical protein Ddye_020009 [Dipteronia dyeriana]